MDNNFSLADIAAASGANGGNSLLLIVLLVLIFCGGFNGRGELGQYASTASQQQILFGQQFQNLDNKADRLGNGIADATFALNNAVTTEGRTTQAALAQYSAQTMSAIHADGEATRALINQNEMQRLRDELASARADLNNNAQSGYILGQIGKWYANPPCYGNNCVCNG